jgi:hypothetical protein
VEDGEESQEELSQQLTGDEEEEMVEDVAVETRTWPGSEQERNECRKSSHVCYTVFERPKYCKQS